MEVEFKLKYDLNNRHWFAITKPMCKWAMYPSLLNLNILAQEKWVQKLLSELLLLLLLLFEEQQRHQRCTQYTG